MTNNALPSIYRHLHHYFVATLFFACIFISQLIPPAQSPDEGAHLKRAYLLTQGYIRLEKQGNDLGGLIDSGFDQYLAAYFVALSQRQEKKLSANVKQDINSIVWSGKKTFSGTSGTVAYFPLLYVPQAVALATGEALGLTVDRSHQLARFCSLLAASLILWLAFLIYRPPLSVLALLLLPMSIFQMASPSLDGMANATALLAISCFMRIAQEGQSSKPWLLVLLSLSVFAVASCRAQLLPLLLLIFVAYIYTRQKAYLWVATSLTTLILFWMSAALQGVSIAPAENPPTREIVIYYLLDPLALLRVMGNTLSLTWLMEFYGKSFLGILGWLDSKFSERVYFLLTVLLALSFVFSTSFHRQTTAPSVRWVLLFCALSAVALIFLALLVAWTKHPAQWIDGVQGRYFLVPTMLLAYALAPRFNEGWRSHLGVMTLVFLGLFSVTATTRLLVDRYYIAPNSSSSYEMRPSAPLAQNQPIALHSIDSQIKKPPALSRLGILIGTYNRSNPGEATLQLTAPDGSKKSIPFELSSLADNEYKFFDLDGTYAQAEILFKTGGGISVWQAHSTSSAQPQSCLVYGLKDLPTQYTPGCPKP